MNNLNIMSKIAKELIGYDINSCKAQTKEEILTEERDSLLELLKERLNPNEHITYGFDIKTGKRCYSVKGIPPKIDKMKLLRLDCEDVQILNNEFCLFDGNPYEYEYGISDMDDDILIIMTTKRSWNALCGRMWYYNKITKKVKVKMMS